MKTKKIEWPSVADYGLCQKGINPADEGKICIIDVSPAILDDFYSLGIDFSELESLHDQWIQDHDICSICSEYSRESLGAGLPSGAQQKQKPHTQRRQTVQPQPRSPKRIS